LSCLTYWWSWQILIVDDFDVIDFLHVLTERCVQLLDIAAAGRWPRLTSAAAEVGFAAVHAVPMRLRKEVIGALNLFGTKPGALDEGTLRMGAGSCRRGHDRLAAAAGDPPP
jgi:hypothetical protein